MGKKYIIEIPEDKIGDFVGSTHFLMPYMMAGHIGHHDTGLPIEPYTEPDLEYVRKEAFEEGKKQAKVQAELDVCHDIEKVAKENYKAGLADAWEAARKIHRMPDGDILDLFPDCYASVCTAAQAILKYDASEAIAKIKEYEDSKQEIKVGDEVTTDAGNRASVLYENPDGTQVFVFKSDGTATWWTKSALHRTGRNFPEIAAVLEKMRGRQE